MANEGTIAMEATDVYALGSPFNPQGSESDHNEDQARQLSSVGNIACTTLVNGITQYPCSYKYCAGDSNFVTDLGAMLTSFGDVVAGVDPNGGAAITIAPTAMRFNWSAGEYMGLDIEGHQHDEALHVAGSMAVFNAAALIATADGSGFGVPAFGLTAGTNASPISASLRISMNHVDRPGSDGNHWFGTNVTPEAELSMTWEGLPTTNAKAAIKIALENYNGAAVDWDVLQLRHPDANESLDQMMFRATTINLSLT